MSTLNDYSSTANGRDQQKYSSNPTRTSLIDDFRMQELRKKYYVSNLKQPKLLREPRKWPVKKLQRQRKPDLKPPLVLPQKHPPVDEESSRILPYRRHHLEAEGQRHSRRAVFVVVGQWDGERLEGQRRVPRVAEVFEDEEP